MNVRTNRSVAAHAFTLIEVLIAVAVASILLIAVNTVFYGAVRLREKTTKAVEQSLPLEQAIAFLRRDLRALAVPGGTFGGSLQTTASSSSLMGATAVSPSFYTTSALIDDALPWGNIQRVAYYLRPSTNAVEGGGFDLVRAVTRNLLAPTQEEVLEQWLMGGVTAMQFQYFNGTDWKTDWDSTTETPPLPKAVKVLLSLVEPDASLRAARSRTPMQFVFPVSSQGSTNQTQSTTGGAG